MSVTGKSTKSYRKTDLQNDKSLQVVKSFRFAHKASAGDPGFSIYALNVPTEMTSLGFSQPSANDISKANLLFYKNNLSIVSSARGQLNLEYDYVVTSTGISFTDLFGTALDGEIFVCTLNSVATTGNLVADTNFICETGTLAANTTSIAVGQSFKVNQNPTKQLGAVMLFIDGQQMLRNVGNATANPSADGDYEEVDNGYGDCTLLEMNNSSVSARTYTVVSSWLSVVKPDGSVVETINKQQATIDKVVETLAVVAGVPETDFQAAPTQPQLNQFGDRLISLESENMTINGVKTYPDKPTCSAYVSSNQTGKTSEALYTVPFSVEEFDIGSIYNSGTYRIQPTVAGKYLITCNIHTFSNSLNSLRGGYAQFNKNGSAYKAFGYENHTTTAYRDRMAFTGSIVVDFNGASDYLEVIVMNTTSAGTWTIEGGSWLTCVKVS